MKTKSTIKALAVMGMIALLSACNPNESVDNKAGQISISKAPEFLVTSGDVVLAQSNNSASARMMKAPSKNGLLEYESRSFNWGYPVDIFEHFPEFVTPEGYYDDFVFESNGEPFDIVMLYSNGGYRHLMGIYWYDGDNCYEQQLWDERDDEAAHTWVNFNGSDSHGAISRKSDEAGAYTIQLPKGTKYGFYCHSLLYDEDIVEGIRTPLPFGPIVDYVYKFYTEKEKNWSYMVAEYDKYAEQGKTTTQAMYTEVNDWTIVGFEDRSITHPGCDRDYNDCVFAIKYQAPEKDEPNETDQVEVNLSLNDEHVNGDYVASKLSIHVRSITDVEVLLPIAKEYYCEADDMDISLSHREPNMKYNTDPQYVDMQIAGTTVTFMVQYEDEGIRVTTDGINQDVIDYCATNYGDGITFEVWNYFKDITRENLKPMLDNSTVTFLDHNPALYINAFAKVIDYEGAIYSKPNEAGQLVPYMDEECTQPLAEQYWTRPTPDSKDYVFVGEQNPWDCVVVPTDASYKKSGEEATALSSNYNVKYRR